MPINFPASIDTALTLLTAKNSLKTLLNGALAADSNGNNGQPTIIDVVSTTGFPASGLILIDAEVISYTGITATSFTGITRAQDGTATGIHVTNDDVKLGIVAGYHTILTDAIIAIETYAKQEATPVGTVRSTIKATADTGWLVANGDTLGSATSGATQANALYETLFKMLWNDWADAEAPVITGRGASANADWAANKKITMPDMRQYIPVGYKSADSDFGTLGKTGGAKTVAHTHAGGNHSHYLLTSSNSDMSVAVTYRVVAEGGGTIVAYQAGGGPNTKNILNYQTDAQNPTTGAASDEANLQPYRTLNFQIKY